MNVQAQGCVAREKLITCAMKFARGCGIVGVWLGIFCSQTFAAQQNPIQFDVFLGYDGLVSEASWFPVICEIRNNGPSFTATIEVSGGTYNQDQTIREVVELPTGTLKRVVIPVFATPRNYSSSWDVRLLDERGRTRSEQTGLRARKQIPSNIPLVGGLPRSPGGMPAFRPSGSDQSDGPTLAARFQSPIFPDNPLVLEGLGALYLNSEKATELRDSQVEALLAWLHAGGHLVVAIEQISDVTSVPWLRNLLPLELKDIQAVLRHSELQAWVRTAYWSTNSSVSGDDQAASMRRRYNVPGSGNQRGKRRTSPLATPAEVDSSNPTIEVPDDPAFELASLQVATGTLRDGGVVVSAGETPLIITANRGRGRVTALLFSPEREPMRSWKNLPFFWSRVVEVPPGASAANVAQQGGWSGDGIFGAMIDTRQVHKLPVEWLLLLLLVYLVVIGPLDQFWLKKIGRPMLTWITFPCYVVMFSLVIYFIGYKLRAGESEWNEVHLVDVMLKGDHAELRGRTYSSVYSPANQRYLLESQQKYATFRSEFAGTWSGSQSSEKANVLLTGDNFKAEIFVPVWTSQLFVTDWWQSAPLPLSVTITNEGDGWRVKVENRTERKLTNAQIVIEGRITSLGDLGPKEVKSSLISRSQGVDLRQFVASHSSNFQRAAQSRQHAFGSSESGRIDDLPNASIAASFLSEVSGEGNQPNFMRSFIMPPGLDLSAAVEHGLAVVLAWDDGYSPAKPMFQFTPRRSHRDTLWRIAAEVPSPKS
jgi:hypothetical protein